MEATRWEQRWQFTSNVLFFVVVLHVLDFLIVLGKPIWQAWQLTNWPSSVRLTMVFGMATLLFAIKL